MKKLTLALLAATLLSTPVWAQSAPAADGQSQDSSQQKHKQHKHKNKKNTQDGSGKSSGSN